MAENLDFKGTVELSVEKAVQDLDRLIDQAKKVEDALSGSKGLSNLEKSFEGVRKTAEDFKKTVDELQKLDPDKFAVLEDALNKGLIRNPELKKGVSHVRDLRLEVDRAHDAALKMNAAFDKAKQDEAFATYEPNLKATRERITAAKELEREYAQLANTRYALQDLAFTWTAVSAATLGAATAAVKVGADYEKSFRSVQRTTLTMGDAAKDLKNELIDLTTTIPQQFDDIANIATLGAQMDVPTENLEKFTETVAMFSSTTDVSVDKTAMSFGRLAQLTKTPIDSIDRLASSVYHVGINSVATEGQILAIAEQIAVSGNLAGFANHEIIGLSAALASLGVQPEAARGAIMRIFNNIRMGVDEGGEALEQFAQVSGTSAQDFAQAWLNRPQEAFNMFIEGLSRVADEGGSVSLVLKEMGLSNVRDLRVLELLADNTEVYADALDDAAQSYASNTALAEGYAIETDNLNDQLTLLMNSFKGMLAEVGDIPFLSELVKWATKISESFRTLLKNPIAGWFARITIGLLGAVGAFAAYQAISARATASTAGLIQSLRGMQGMTERVKPGIMGLINVIMNLRRVEAELAAETQGANAALNGQAVASRNAATGLKTIDKSGKAAASGVGAATTAVRAFGKATIVIAAVSLALEGASRAWDWYNESTKSATDRMEDFMGSSTALRDALVEDGKTLGQGATVVATWSRKVEESGDAAEGAAVSLGIAADGQVNLREETQRTTEAVEDQILAFGEQSKKAVIEAFNKNLSEADFSEFQQRLFSGFDFEDFGKELFDDIANGTDNATQKLNEYEAGLHSLSSAYAQIHGIYSDPMSATVESWQTVKDTIAEIPPEIRGKLSPAYQELLTNITKMSNTDLLSGKLNEDIKVLTKGLYDGGDGADYVARKLSEIFKIGGQDIAAYAQEVALANQASDAFAAGLGLVGDESEDVEEKLDGVETKLKELAGSMFESVMGTANLEDALERLGASIYEHGDDFSAYTESGRANLAALEAAVNAMAVNAGDDMEAFANNIYDMLGSLEAQGINTVEMLDFVYLKLIEITGDSYGVDVSTAAARQNLLNLLQDGQAVQKVLDELQGLQRKYQEATTYSEVLAIADREKELKGQIQLVEDLGKRISQATDVAVRSGNTTSRAVGRGVTNAYNKAREAANKAGGAGKKAGKDAADAAKKAAKEIRTLADYVSDLSSTMSRAFEFRFGVQTSKDSTADIWSTIRKNAEDAREAVKKALQDIMDANAKLQGLKADKTILQYQLTVAEEYGDTLRATQIRAELAEKNAEIAKTEKEKADAQKAAKAAQDATNKTLVGNSDIARKNRADILSLVQSYQKQIEALADSGLSSKQLQRETERLRQDFIRQATQAGYSRTEINKYAKSFSDMSTIISKVPRKITVKADVNPAQRAINEFLAKKQKNVTIGTTVKNPSKSSVNAAKNYVAKQGKPTLQPAVRNPSKGSIQAMARNFMSVFRTTIKAIKFTASFLGKSVGFLNFFRSGGYTGRGNFDELAGMVHRGEYVVPAQYVNQATGLPDLNALGQSLGMNTYNSSVSSVTNTTTVAVVELSARDRQLLAAAGNVSVNLDGRLVAANTNQHNLNSSRRGIG